MRRWVCILFLLGLPAASRAQQYTVLDLGTLGGTGGNSYGVNNSGQVTGVAVTSAGQGHAFLWTPGQGMIDLGTLEGSTTSRGSAVNASGQVTGFSGSHAFRWTPESGMLDLGTLGGSSNGTGINGSGYVSGYSYTATNNFPTTKRAILWTEATGMMNLGTLGGTHSEGYGINDASQVVGWSETSDGGNHAFRWTPGVGMQDLGTFDGTGWSYAQGINNAGHVAGNVRLAGSNRNRAFLWTPEGGMQNIHGFGFDTFPWAINASDHVVGEAWVAFNPIDIRGFLWTPEGGMKDLNTLLVPEDSGWKIGSAWSINDFDYIAAEARNAEGVLRAVLLVPTAVPEPTTFALVGGVTGVGLWHWRRRRRQREAALDAAVTRC
jgi:probable HAF family extracellular repeat protein